jgi:hypothetical protein
VLTNSGRSWWDGHSATTTVVGSCFAAKLPEELDLFFENGVLIDRRNRTPMEMDGYSLYLVLIAIERISGRDLRSERTRLVEAIVARFRTKGFWPHGAWTRSDNEIHMRFTAAAIRLLIEASDEGLLNDRGIIVEALKKHVEYSEGISSGLWFLHDSLEVPGNSDHYRNANRFRAWGATSENCLVLNTHLDTLATLLQFLERCEVDDNDRRFFQAKINSGLSSLHAVLAARIPARWRILGTFDSIVRSIFFQTFARQSSINRFVQRVVRRYFRVRRIFKCAHPHFVMSDGYLERDIGLNGTAFEYHTANVYDLARLSAQLRKSDDHRDTALIKQCEDLVDAGLNYATRTSYKCYWRAAMEENGKPILLCEAILARLATMPDRASIPQAWISAYCEIRRRTPPSAAIVGYDPLTVSCAMNLPAPVPGIDSGLLLDGRRFSIDLIQERIAIEGNRSRAFRD